MKIKDVENKVGLTKANIRYYESEGLISPVRNKENNYREYSEADVKRLLEIKKLRLLGIPVHQIERLYTGSISLEDALQECLTQLVKEEQGIQEAKAACKAALEMNLDMSSIGQIELTEDKKEWQQRLTLILKEDIVKKRLTKEQLNSNIALLLVMGCFINLITVFLIRKYFLSDPEIWSSKLFFGLVILSLVLSFFPYFTSNIKIHFSGIVAGAFMQSPIIVSFLISLSPKGNALFGHVPQFMYHFMPALWIGMLVLTLFLWAGSKKNTFILGKLSSAITLSLLFTGIMTGLFYFISGLWLLPSCLSLLISLPVCVMWTTSNTEYSCYSRYHAVCTVAKMTNIAALVISAHGYHGTYNWRR